MSKEYIKDFENLKEKAAEINSRCKHLIERINEKYPDPDESRRRAFLLNRKNSYIQDGIKLLLDDLRSGGAFIDSAEDFEEIKDAIARMYKYIERLERKYKEI